MDSGLNMKLGEKPRSVILCWRNDPDEKLELHDFVYINGMETNQAHTWLKRLQGREPSLVSYLGHRAIPMDLSGDVGTMIYGLTEAGKKILKELIND